MTSKDRSPSEKEESAQQANKAFNSSFHPQGS